MSQLDCQTGFLNVQRVCGARCPSCYAGSRLTGWAKYRLLATFLQLSENKMGSGGCRGRISGYFLNDLLLAWNIGRHEVGLQP